MQYVRREIRQLTHNDREAFFDAMETLYRLPTAEGHKKYGEEYKVKAPAYCSKSTSGSYFYEIPCLLFRVNVSFYECRVVRFY